jgi:hypothetical protein
VGDDVYIGCQAGGGGFRGRRDGTLASMMFPTKDTLKEEIHKVKD